MSLFDLFTRKSSAKPPEVADQPLRQKLVKLVLDALTDPNGRIRAEDAISAAATIVAERCIDAAGDFPLRDHELAPGERAFSNKANLLIFGDVSGGVAQIPKDSIVGTLRHRLDPQVYIDADFPELSEVCRQFAARTGHREDWGKVGLSVGKDNLPFILPLRAGYMTRGRVDEILHPIREDKTRCLRIATESLAEILTMVASTIDHRLALSIAIETLNGMAKTVPMTKNAMMQQAQKSNPEPKK